MNSTRLFALALLIPFAALTLYTVMDVGYIEIFNYQRHSSAGWQVLADLVVALLLVLSWLIPDARKTGRNPWPWVLMTPFIGSISPLLYLATRKESAAAP
jgi:hypothetical protein